MAKLNDRVSEILKSFERVKLLEETKIMNHLNEELRKLDYRHKRVYQESEERAKKIYITC